MSRRYFGTRKIYLDLAKTETYQKHKENFFLLDQGNLNIDVGNLNIDVFRNKHNFQNYIGVETLTKAMASMFPKETGFQPTLIQNFSLPRKNMFLVQHFLSLLRNSNSSILRQICTLFLLTFYRQTKLGKRPLQRTFLTKFLFQLLEYTKRLELCTVVLMRNVLQVIDMHVEY